ncbi:MAG: hypothetical protein JXR63_08690 [Spirochaetales bacterium]|nr:hypothetical protein [Spirochaetales bacterium]
MKKINFFLLIILTTTLSLLLLADVDASKPVISCELSSYTYDGESSAEVNSITVSGDFSVTGRLFQTIATKPSTFNYADFNLGEVKGRVYNSTSGTKKSEWATIAFTGDKDDLTLNIVLADLFSVLPSADSRVDVLLKFADKTYIEESDPEKQIDYPAFANLVFTYEKP